MWKAIPSAHWKENALASNIFPYKTVHMYYPFFIIFFYKLHKLLRIEKCLFFYIHLLRSRSTVLAAFLPEAPITPPPET
jgi:hypothetical protein